MTLRELWKKILVLSTVAPTEDGGTPSCLVIPQMVDAKGVSWYTSHPEPGRACNTCVHFHLNIDLEPGSKVPPEVKHIYTEEELVNMVTYHRRRGCCSKMLNIYGILVVNTWSDHGCGFWEEKMDQFDDDVIEEDDGRTPVVPTVHI